MTAKNALEFNSTRTFSKAVVSNAKPAVGAMNSHSIKTYRKEIRMTVIARLTGANVVFLISFWKKLMKGSVWVE